VAGGTNGLAPTLDNLLDLKKEVAVDNADIGAAAFLTNAKVEAVLAKLKDSQNQYLLNPYGTELGRSQIAGRRFEVSNNVPSNLTKGSGSNLSAVIYGNFADLLVGLFGTLEILVDPYTDFAKGTTGIRALQSIDLAVRHPESFAAMQDAIA
jgi:HK97 family phage major capsid protein